MASKLFERFAKPGVSRTAQSLPVGFAMAKFGHEFHDVAKGRVESAFDLMGKADNVKDLVENVGTVGSVADMIRTQDKENGAERLNLRISELYEPFP